MYRVIGKGTVILTFIFLALGIAAAGTAAARYLPTDAAERQLPIYSVETSEKTAALGINCAWDDSDIDEILTLLDEGSVKATFFIVGDWCDKYPDAVRRIADAGHELGSHSDTHPDMTTLSRAQIERELGESKRKIEGASGKSIRLFRAPSGAYNNLTVSTARGLGWEVIQWSNDSLDWKTPPVDEMVSRVCDRAAPGDIMLFHAGRKNTAEALRQVISRLHGEGYSFKPVGELIFPAPYTIDHAGRQRRGGLQQKRVCSATISDSTAQAYEQSALC